MNIKRNAQSAITALLVWSSGAAIIDIEQRREPFHWRCKMVVLPLSANRMHADWGGVLGGGKGETFIRAGKG